jgi:acyl-CoA reductase-like NAD-dependent aldehyde dehydrogenase
VTAVASTPVPEAAPRIAGGAPAVSEWAEFRDPYRGTVASRVARSGPDVVDAAVRVGLEAQPALAELPVSERAAILRRAADLIETRVDEYAQTISRSVGKAFKSTRREVARSALTLRSAATAAESLRTEVPQASALPEGRGLLAIALRQPVGVVGAVTPFNAPFNLVVHKVAPSFVAGNATVIKPASQTALTALDVASVLEEAGAPPGTISVVPGDRTTVDAMLADPRIALVTFTGGRLAGSAIARGAGIRRVLLELGGNSPNIVHGDADMDLAVRQVVAGGFANTGQSCNSVQRVFVDARIADEFTSRVVAGAAALRVGDPLDPTIDIGTLVDEAAAVRVAEWIADARKRGARVLVGGERTGASLNPTVVVDAPEDSRLVCEEIFGPVVAILPYRTLDEALERANASELGLQSAVFTSSLAVAIRAAERLASGGVLVNRSTNFRLDHLPYGGIKDSGIGREGPAYAIEEMTNLKTILIDPGAVAGVA